MTINYNLDITVYYNYDMSMYLYITDNTTYDFIKILLKKIYL